jgi:hypothetical protein
LEAVKKMWFIMDLPLNAHRIALMRSTDYITPTVLENMTHFLLKVDMFFTEPKVATYPHHHANQRMFPAKWAGKMQSGVALRRMLLAERQLSSLWRVVRGWSWDATDSTRPMTRLDALRLWVRHSFKFPEGTPECVKKEDIMSIPWYEIGTAGLERTGVSFYDLVPKKPEDGKADKGEEQSKSQKVAVTHPFFANSGPQPTTNQKQNFYPHALRLHLAHEKPREPLLRPDQLVVREAIRRKTQMHRKWVEMMLWGFCDRMGVAYPIQTEEEILKGLREEDVSEEADGVDKDTRKETQVQNEVAAEIPFMKAQDDVEERTGDAGDAGMVPVTEDTAGESMNGLDVEELGDLFDDDDSDEESEDDDEMDDYSDEDMDSGEGDDAQE